MYNSSVGTDSTTSITIFYSKLLTFFLKLNDLFTFWFKFPFLLTIVNLLTLIIAAGPLLSPAGSCSSRSNIVMGKNFQIKQRKVKQSTSRAGYQLWLIVTRLRCRLQRHLYNNTGTSVSHLHYVVEFCLHFNNRFDPLYIHPGPRESSRRLISAGRMVI